MAANNNSTTGGVNPGGLSDRAWGNVKDIMPKIAGAVAERVKIDNPSIDLASAENWLVRPEVIEICKNAVNHNLTDRDLSYPRAFAGFPEVLEAFTGFFNEYFNPKVPVEQSHLSTAPGAASCLDTILYNVCNPGDGVLVPSPYWSGFDFQFKARSSAVPIAVPVSPITDTMTDALLPALEAAYAGATIPVRALLMSNPQNPLGQCYPQKVIEDCMRFCQAKSIHYISDEVYALTHFPAPDAPEPTPFVSALSIDLPAISVEGKWVHTFWGPSKDFGMSGVRMGCSITQFNREMAVGLALASNTQTSTLSSIFVTALLTSQDLPKLIQLNSERLLANYNLLTDVLRKHKVHYIPSYAGLYLYAQVCKPKGRSDIVSWEDEAEAVGRAKKAGVILSAGRGYHGHENDRGWARIGFAVDAPTMKEACVRLDSFFDALDQ